MIWYIRKQAYTRNTLSNFKRIFRLDQEKIKPEVKTRNPLYSSLLTGSTLWRRILMNSAGWGFQKEKNMAPSVSRRKGLGAFAVTVDKAVDVYGPASREGSASGKGFVKFQVCSLSNFYRTFLVSLWEVMKRMVKVCPVLGCPVPRPRRQKYCPVCV